MDMNMTVEQALREGWVMRVYPLWVCGSGSPESNTMCRLEPGHKMTRGHYGFENSVSVGWGA